jgi:hypothetical protein
LYSAGPVDMPGPFWIDYPGKYGHQRQKRYQAIHTCFSHHNLLFLAEPVWQHFGGSSAVASRGRIIFNPMGR